MKRRRNLTHNLASPPAQGLNEDTKAANGTSVGTPLATTCTISQAD